ncbi:MAG: bZIP transcription factor [Halorhabdus sp.]
MSGNRVEELESQVKDLEATVEGLTDELVECKVRLRELENVVDADIGFEDPVDLERRDPAADAESGAATEQSESTSAEADKDQGTDVPDDAEVESDIIIA